MPKQASSYDVVVVGAGFAGVYAIHRLRSAGYSVRVLEAGDGIGGTWFWNRYPGARCDIESLQYSYSFSEEIQQEWKWSDRYATQSEILRYIEFVADRLDLRRDIQLDTRVVSATYDDDDCRWEIVAEGGERFRSPYVIMATGCLSAPLDPDIKGIGEFSGPIYRTTEWPRGEIDFRGMKVGVIGTGSSAIQLIPHVAEAASHLTVFQRTPNFSIPAHNGPLDPDFEREWKTNYRENRLAASKTRNNALMEHATRAGEDLGDDELRRVFEYRWRMGGLAFVYCFNDFAKSKRVNNAAAEFVRSKIAGIVKDPATAEKLAPRDYPIGAKRLCVDSFYYETFNRDNVRLVDLKQEPIETVTATGIRTTSTHHDLDAIILATGFDAMTGALTRIDIAGKAGRKLGRKWDQAPKTLLGLAVAGFPNLFLVTGPGSPSVFSNMVTSIEQMVDWIVDCLGHMRRHGFREIEATEEAEESWFSHVNEVAGQTLMLAANSWYVGANVAGKPRVFMPYLGGVGPYLHACEDSAKNGYKGFELT